LLANVDFNLLEKIEKAYSKPALDAILRGVTTLKTEVTPRPPYHSDPVEGQSEFV